MQHSWEITTLPTVIQEMSTCTLHHCFFSLSLNSLTNNPKIFKTKENSKYSHLRSQHQWLILLKSTNCFPSNCVFTFVSPFGLDLYKLTWILLRMCPTVLQLLLRRLSSSPPATPASQETPALLSEPGEKASTFTSAHHIHQTLRCRCVRPLILHVITSRTSLVFTARVSRISGSRKSSKDVSLPFT